MKKQSKVKSLLIPAKKSTSKKRIILPYDGPQRFAGGFRLAQGGLPELGKLLLESQGYEVLIAGDGFEGLIALKQSMPPNIQRTSHLNRAPLAAAGCPDAEARLRTIAI